IRRPEEIATAGHVTLSDLISRKRRGRSQPMGLAVLFMSAMFSFLAVAAWSGNRTRERELYYRSEVLKKAMETTGPEPAAGLARLRDEDIRRARTAMRAKRGGLLPGGMTVTAAGLGLMIFMRSLPDSTADARAFYLVGLMPLLVGIALMIGALLVKDE